MIDLGKFASDATRDLDARQAALIEQRDTVAERTREAVRRMTRGELLAQIVTDVERGRIRVRLNGKERRGDLVDIAARAYGNASAAGETLARLRRDAESDRRMAERVNSLIEQSEKALTTLTHHVDKDGNTIGKLTAAEVAQRMLWHGDAFMVTADTAGYAYRVAEAVRNDHDIRDIVDSLQTEAARRIGYLAQSVFANGVGGVSRSEAVYKAAAAREFLSAVNAVYGWSAEPLTVPVNALT